MNEVTNEECVEWLRREIKAANDPLRQSTDTDEERRAQDFRRAILNHLLFHPL